MTSEERFQISTNPEPDTADDDDRAQEQNNSEAVTNVLNTSSKPVRRSRFFRSKRKHRFVGEQSNQSENPTTNNNNDDDEEEPNELVDSSESREKSIEKPPDEEDCITNEIDPKPIPMPSTRRLTSPPPSPPPSTSSGDDNDETDTSMNSDEGPYSAEGEDLDAERQAYLAKKQNYIEEPVIIETKRPSPISFSGYQRKKSQSVKLTNADRIDAYSPKKVRFADDFGLDLSQIRVIKSDELPHVPSTAFKDLHISNDDDAVSFYQERMKVITYLEPQFENPMQAQGFDDRVGRHKVALEQANAIDNRIYGTVKIVSFSVNKRVKVRFTTDNWISYRDTDATYIMDSYDGLHDRFTFTLDIDRDRICMGNNIQFCVGYESYVGPEYWDSNYQQNYRFDCVSRTIPDYSG